MYWALLVWAPRKSMQPYASVGTATVCRAGFQCSPGNGRGSTVAWVFPFPVVFWGTLAELDILSTWEDSEVAASEVCLDVST